MNRLDAPRRCRIAAPLLALLLAACGGGGGAGPAPQPLPPPVLSALSTAVGAAAGGEEVTLTGSGFVPPVVVRFGAVQEPIVSQSTTSVVVRTSAAAAGQVQVTMANADAQASNTLPFTFLAGTPPPHATAVSPDHGSTLGGVLVSVSGSGFSTSGATVAFGTDAATLVSATASALTVRTPAHAPGLVAITVTNADAQASTLSGAYTFIAPPQLTQVAPASGSTGGGDAVVLSGSGFSVAPPPTVTIGGNPAAVAAGGSATQLTVTTPAHGAGPAAVVLINPDGQADTLPGAFTFTAPAGTPPTVASVLNDATGLASGTTAGGEAVTLTGTGFAPGALVFFGAAPATGVAWSSPTTLHAVTPLGQPAGPVDVTVSLPGTGGLAGTLGQGFSFLAPAPAVAAFNKVGSPAAGGGLMLIRGTHLQAGSVVTFGGAVATVTDFTPGVAGTLDGLTLIIPASPLLPGVADGFVDVVVTNPDGQASTLAPRTGRDGTPWPGNFHYGPPPVATGFSPGTGKGLDVTLTGVGFSADATGPRSGLQVLFQGHSFVNPPIRVCPNAADPACPAGAVSPAPDSVIVTLPSRQLNPGNYAFAVTNFDGQFSVAPGTFVVP